MRSQQGEGRYFLRSKLRLFNGCFRHLDLRRAQLHRGSRSALSRFPRYSFFPPFVADSSRIEFLPTALEEIRATIWRFVRR